MSTRHGNGNGVAPQRNRVPAMTGLAFSTLGCPGLPVSEVADLAARHGFSGVELRAAEGEPVQVGLDASERRAAAAALADRGVRALSIASYVRVAQSGPGDEDIVTAGLAHGRLAADLGARYLRVFPGGPAPGDRSTDAAAAVRLRAIRDGLAGTGVTVALETHDSHPRGADVARLLDRCPGVLAIWDVLHPWRAGEPPAETLAVLRDRLAYVQIKDVVSAEDPAPLPPGDGALPLAAMAQVLRDNGYHAWVSWEYERAWFPDQPSLPDTAARATAWMRVAFPDD